MIYFELNDPEIRKHYNLTQKRLKLGMVSSFDPLNVCAKFERITAWDQQKRTTNQGMGPMPTRRGARNKDNAKRIISIGVTVMKIRPKRCGGGYLGGNALSEL